MNGHVTITLKELKTGRVVSREIDITNIIDWDTMRPVPTLQSQEIKLNEWIKERGEDQHDSKLELIHWDIQEEVAS